MIKEGIQYLLGLNKPIATLKDGRHVLHRDYSIGTDTRGVNFEQPIVRHVIKQSILNKKDFINFINEYKTPDTKLFFDNRSLRAIFNYSNANEANYGDSYCQMELEKTVDFTNFISSLDHDLSQKELVRLLKRLEPYIIGFNGKPVDDMDIIEVAEHLQASKNFSSVERNTVQAFTIDATVTAGNKSYEIPRFINFKIPVFKNDIKLEVQFDCEVFLTASESSFVANLVCYKLDETIETTIRTITEEVCAEVGEVKSFMV